MPSARLPVDAPPAVFCTNALPFANVKIHVLPLSEDVGGSSASDASVGSELSFRPLPAVLSKSSRTAPAARVTGWSKLSVRDLTWLRWSEASFRVTEESAGAGRSSFQIS